MTRMQAISKAVLTALGIHAVVALAYSYPGRYYSAATRSPFTTALDVLFFLAFMALVVFVAYVMILRNGALVRAITGDEDAEPQADPGFLVKSLRIGLVLAGLMLLPGSARFLAEVLRWPFVFRQVINEWIIAGITPYLARFTWPQWYMMGFRLFRAALVVYLIAGAPHLVRFQVRQSFDLDPDPTQTNDLAREAQP